MDENTNEELAAQNKAKHMRKALEALPSFDFDATDNNADTEASNQQAPIADTNSEATIITHEREVNTNADDQLTAQTTDDAQWSANLGSDDDDKTSLIAEDDVAAEIGAQTEPISPIEAMASTDAAPLEDDIQTELAEEAAAEEEALSSLTPTTQLQTPPTYQDPVVPAQAQTVMAEPLGQPISEGAYNYETAFSQEANEGASQRRKKVLKHVLIILGALVGALAIIYVAVSLYFTAHFLPNTTVNGEDVSGMSVTDLSAYVSSIGENYKTTVTGDNVDLKVAGTDINFVYDGNAYSTQAAGQIDSWRWPLELNETHEYVVDQAITYNEEELEKLVREAVDKANEGSSQPTNATMTYDDKQGKFVVVPDALGTAINPDAVVPVVSQGVSTLQTEIKLGDKELVQPTITKDNEKLLGNIDTVNGMMDKTITLRIANKDATKVDKSLMSGWYSLDGESNISVNEDAIREWAKNSLSEEFDTVGKPRSYTRPDGKEITVEGGSYEYDYGWSLNSDELAGILANSLRTINTDPIDVPMHKEAATWNPGGQDWPARYIDVDLSEQYVRMYDESSNVIWESDCVSGNPIYGGGTDTGVYFVYLKKSPEILKGLDYNGDNQPDYEVPVTYWMPFDGGEGLHDATSRGAFGGSIYTYDGSHGCVNLPYSAAEALWGIVEVGDPVVVHW